jgi:hypothetical protein
MKQREAAKKVVGIALIQMKIVLAFFFAFEQIYLKSNSVEKKSFTLVIANR